VTSTIDQSTISERPTEGSDSSYSPAQPRLPALFWAAVILFVMNLFVLFSIWLSPDLRVGLYGEDTGTLAGSYTKPSAFTETVKVAVGRKPRQPQKVRPAFYQELQPVTTADLALPRTTVPAAAQSAAYLHTAQESYSGSPRITSSSAPRFERVVHVGFGEIAPRTVVAQD
jgi:hypothetical protein